MPRRLKATRYVTPLREGGSLPAIIEAEDDGLYVLKFRASGQGTKALIAELLSGEIARAIGLRVPEIVFVDLDPALGRNEPDSEIRSLVTRSAGINLALDYLPGSITFDAAASKRAPIDPMLASRVVWFDAFTTNIDRTARNTNMLVWHKNLWLIDHGASLFFQHQWKSAAEKSNSPFAQIKDHVLLPDASELIEADRHVRPLLSKNLFEELVRLIPPDWLEGDSIFANADEERRAYVTYFMDRLNSGDHFLKEAIDARAALL